MGFKFGPRSRAARDTLDPRLQKIVDRVIEFMDISILYGHRPKEEQLEIWSQGRELRPGGDQWNKDDWSVVDVSQIVTKAFPGESKHNEGPPAPAMDISPYPVDYSNRMKKVARFYYLAGIVKGIAEELGIKIRWGGDWDSDNDFEDQTFDDLAHFEVVG